MNRTVKLTFFILMFSGVASASDYPVSALPETMKENAFCVVRNFTEDFELYSINSGIKHFKKAITVLDKNGEDDAILKINYDKDSKVKIIQITIFDKNGNRVKKVKQSEIIDVPAYDGAALYSDYRFCAYKPDYPVYPYTIEYEYTIESTNMISYGAWYPLTGYNISVEHSKFTFIHPAEARFHKKEINLGAQSIVTNQGSKTSETWEANNLKALEYEPFAVYLAERIPRVYLMPSELAYDNNTGSANNWGEYGKWVYNLYSGRDELADNEKAVIDKLVTEAGDTVQKIRKLYEYMQGRTRYVGIQLGIGGFQPFPAKTVYETGYGDCKALSNYMHSMLSYLGIKSYVALVSSGRYIELVFKEFPNFQQFDHVILCVPLRKDTLWLECTSQTIPFGFLGDFTDDRDVLLITEQGGEFAHTRTYSAMDNLRTSKAEFNIDSDGSARCSIRINYQGLQYDDVEELLNSNPEDQKKWVYKNSDLPSLTLSKFDIEIFKRPIPEATTRESEISKDYCSFTGNYMILPLNRVNGQKAIPKVLRERQSDFIIHRPSMDYDTLVYHMPAGYKIESIPAGKEINSPFGKYSYSVTVKGSEIVYIRKLEIIQGRHKASDYKSFYDFCLSISKADDSKAMLVK